MMAPTKSVRPKSDFLLVCSRRVNKMPVCSECGKFTVWAHRDKETHTVTVFVTEDGSYTVPCNSEEDAIYFYNLVTGKVFLELEPEPWPTATMIMGASLGAVIAYSILKYCSKS